MATTTPKIHALIVAILTIIAPIMVMHVRAQVLSALTTSISIGAVRKIIYCIVAIISIIEIASATNGVRN